jgi:hypothetical protein
MQLQGLKYIQREEFYEAKMKELTKWSIVILELLLVAWLAYRENFLLLWNAEFRYRFHKSPPLAVVTCGTLSYWAVECPLAGQEMLLLLGKTKFQYRAHKIRPLFPVLSQLNPVHPLTTRFLKIPSRRSSHLRVCLPCGLFSSGYWMHVSFHVWLPHPSDPPWLDDPSTMR